MLITGQTKVTQHCCKQPVSIFLRIINVSWPAVSQFWFIRIADAVGEQLVNTVAAKEPDNSPGYYCKGKNIGIKHLCNYIFTYFERRDNFPAALYLIPILALLIFRRLETLAAFLQIQSFRHKTEIAIMLNNHCHSDFFR